MLGAEPPFIRARGHACAVATAASLGATRNNRFVLLIVHSTEHNCTILAAEVYRIQLTVVHMIRIPVLQTCMVILVVRVDVQNKAAVQLLQLYLVVKIFYARENDGNFVPGIVI